MLLMHGTRDRAVGTAASGAKGPNLVRLGAAPRQLLAASGVVRRGSWLPETPVMIRPGSCYDDGEREVPGMGTTRKYVVIDPATGKVDRRIFSDQATYDD